MRIGIAQVNSSVGDIENNTVLITNTISRGREQNLDLIIFPELVLCGYPPDDLLYRPSLYDKIGRALNTIINASMGIQLLLGYPRNVNGKIYNSCVFIQNGNLITHYDKILLPNYGVFDEKRYFTEGSTPCLIDLNGIRTALTICEDLWSDLPIQMAANAGAKLIISINSSPFHINKPAERIGALKARFHESNLPIIYVNSVGGQDELVFDGASMVMDNMGEIIFRAPNFEEGLYVFETHSENSGSLSFKVPPNLPINDIEEQTIYQALVLAVRDYVRKNRFNGVIIGLSGGIDSALVACIAVDALGKENVNVLLMPSRHTSEMSNADALLLAKNLGISTNTISIEGPYKAFIDELAPVFRELPVDTTEENIQARCRGVLLMAVSNKMHKLVLTTGNKSEMSVGYATLYGDMAGGFSPLKDVSKLQVYRLCKWKNTISNVIPVRIIERPPSAELRPDQKDSDSLPPYEILDPILELYIEQDQNPGQIINAGYNRDDVLRVIKLVNQNEYKRRQSAPGVKISRKAFGRERRYPITSGYREE